MNRNFLFSVIFGIVVTMMVINRLKEEIAMTTPVAKKIPHKTTIHGYDRGDNYHWMRLTDKQKLAKNPDAQTQKVLDNLKAENTYKEARLKHTEQFQEKLFDEIVGRIKKDDESVPYLHNGYWYYTRFEKDKEYPIYCRKKESLDNAEEIMINVNDKFWLIIFR